MAQESVPRTRVVYVGTGRRRVLQRIPFWYENERVWRVRLAKEQEQVCNEMAQERLHLFKVIPVSSSREWQGGWTEGVWLYFEAIS